CGGTGPFPLKNFSSDYLACEEIIQPTPMGRNSVEQPWSAFGVNVFVGNHQVYYHDLLPTNVPNSNFPFPENGIIKSMINAPIIGDRETTDVNVAFRLGLLDYEAWRVDIYNMEDEYGNIVQWVDSVPVRALTWTPKMMTNNDNMMVYLVNSKQANTSEVGIMNEDYPGHPGFCFTFNQKKDIIGNCCPLNVVTSSNQFNQMYNAKMISVNSEHMGRSGELFGVGNLISTMTAKFNGEQVYSGKYAVDSLSIAWLIESITQGKPDGAYEMSFTNANVEVDNNYGQNTTTIYFDQTKEDWNSPVLKMLQLRDVDNNVTDRFNTPEEGIILFAGGDFQPCSKTYLNEYGYERTWNYDDCQPMTVEVSYAPYSTGEWHALEGIEHQAEYDDIPGLGFFYSASLANVSAMSANGWYDLCFRLQDESGNWMEQVLSPAFHINAMVLSGANEIMTDFTNESVIYNLVGQRMRGDLSSLPKGIYIMVRQLQDGSLHSTKVCK
ncbi:MAG: hypothetical protein J6O49_17795, partial [Bacteroidaceae bacterium]|nr:hypothetical protein [Bacteroidaceae bacterium]